MERESSSSGKKHTTTTTTTTSINHHPHNNSQQQHRPHHTTTTSHRDRNGLGIGGSDTLRTRSTAASSSLQDSPDFVLQWGNKKRLRCMKIQTKDHSSDPSHRTTARVDRRVIRTDHNQTGLFVKHRPASPPPPIRVLRNSENMRGSSQGHGTSSLAENNSKMHMQEGRRAGPASANNHHQHHHHNNNSNDVVFEAANEEGHKKGGGGSSSGSEVIPPAVWPPKFVIALTNKEKEEDFMAIKGSKLPQRPKKRSKYVQRNLKLVSPGAWLCDLTLDRYEVREKKTSKKRPRGLKAMCTSSIDSDSE